MTIDSAGPALVYPPGSAAHTFHKNAHEVIRVLERALEKIRDCPGHVGARYETQPCPHDSEASDALREALIASRR